MPQPIRVACEVDFDGLAKLPDHAKLLGHIVAQSSMTDANLAYLLAYLSRTHATVAIAMFQAVVSTEAQRAMLKAAAQTLLTGAELEEFMDLMENFRTYSNGRNRVVHAIWGTSPKHPDKAVWCHSKDYTRLPVTLAVTETAEALPLFNAHYNNMWLYCSLYTVKDLQDVLDRQIAFGEQIRTFITKLLDQHPGLLASVEAIAASTSAQDEALPEDQSPETPRQSDQSAPQAE